jgi:O-methyltransferase
MLRRLLGKLVSQRSKDFYHKIIWISNNFRKIKFNSYIIPETSFFHGSITYDTDGLKTSNNCDFINEPRFARAYQKAVNTKPWPGFTLQWRVYIVCWFADFVKNLEGDFVECGVNTGAYSRAVIDYIDFPKTGKKFYLLDTYEGLAKELVTDDELKAGIGGYFGDYRNVYEQVKETFGAFNAEIIKGRVPDTLPLCKAEKVAYLSIDMNNTVPEIAAAEYFWPKLVKGAIMILDDYGFPVHINQKHAFDRFAREKGVEILCLPTGQGIIIKP